MINKTLDQYALMGNPVSHSPSPFIHSEFAKQTHQSLTYELILVPKNQFPKYISNFQKEGGCGLNITLPFKEEAFDLCDQLSLRAKLAKSVNTILFKPNGEIFGDNTDGCGLVQDLKNHQITIKDKDILMIGAGGAAKGILIALLDEKPHQIHIANRTPQKAIDLAKLFEKEHVLSGSGLNSLPKQSFDIIINATSASLKGESLLLPNTLIHSSTCCYDVVYDTKLTPFLAWAKKNGALHYLNGIGMLLEQAAESFFIWRGIRPKIEPVRESLLNFNVSYGQGS